MKTKSIIGLMSLCFGTIFSSSLLAAVFTVNNAPGGGAQFTQINAAVAAASAGDTLLISGSSDVYTDATLSKSLTLLGPGAFNNSVFGLKARIANVNLSNNSSNSAICGLEFAGGSLSAFAITVSNIRVVNCHFPSSRLLLNLTNSSNVYIQNNIFSGGNSSIEINGGSGNFNFLIDHNIINGFINGSTISGVTVQNNVFYNSAPNGQPSAFFNACSLLVIKNNIFYNSSPSANISSSIYDNNITYSSSTTYSPLGGTNIDNANPLFVNVPNGGNYLVSHDFHLQATSPGKNAGSDGTDIGYYGGIVQVNPSGEPIEMPFIRSMNVLNSNVAPNGNVNVKVISTKSK